GVRPGAGGLLALPYLAGERAPVWDALARGAIVGLTAHTSRLELCRAVLDGVALSTRDLTERLRQVLPPPAEWRVGGGGVRNRVWLRATADAVGSPLEVVDEAGGGAAPARPPPAAAPPPPKTPHKPPPGPPAGHTPRPPRPASSSPPPPRGAAARRGP